eukprot:357881-Chlamydomonas_euryale.AAC.5
MQQGAQGCKLNRDAHDAKPLPCHAMPMMRLDTASRDQATWRYKSAARAGQDRRTVISVVGIWQLQHAWGIGWAASAYEMACRLATPPAASAHRLASRPVTPGIGLRAG